MLFRSGTVSVEFTAYANGLFFPGVTTGGVTLSLVTFSFLLFFCSTANWLILLSLPLWECGLKCKKQATYLSDKRSLPLWECGLKYISIISTIIVINVAPFVGVWIEIMFISVNSLISDCRSLCGSVD